MTEAEKVFRDYLRELDGLASRSPRHGSRLVCNNAIIDHTGSHAARARRQAQSAVQINRRRTPGEDAELVPNA
jgi:hypothetical protein